MTPTLIKPETHSFILFVCSCGMWGKWQDERKHSETCKGESRTVHARVNSDDLRGVRFS